jgi:hypothetical protein
LRKVFLDDIPRWDSGSHKGKINWLNSKGYNIKFTYDDINGYLEIIDFISKGQKVIVLYKNKTNFVSVGQILKCQLKNILKEDIYNLELDINQKHYIDTRNLPISSNGIDWIEVTKRKMKIPFKYDDLFGEIQVVDYDKSYLIVKYNSEIYKIYSGSFLNGNIGAIIGKVLVDYKYNINDIIETCTGHIKILNKTIKINNRGDKRKAYDYKCLNCNNEDIITEDHLLRRNGGCNVCCPSPHKVLKGINDIATKTPWIINWLNDINDAYKYTPKSAKYIKFKCINCGHIKKMCINQFTSNGFSCPKCGDGVSYPEKFMIEVFQQLKIDYQYQYSPNWIKPKRYDFYIPYVNTIVETHGSQHYKETGGKWNKLIKVQQTDLFKKELALTNKINNYIIINCGKSDCEYIKNSILNSKLTTLFDLSNVNWQQCHEYASNNLLKIASYLWNEKTHDTYKIAKTLNISLTTVLIYLKEGVKLGWCDYNKNTTRKESSLKLKGKNSPKARKIICTTTNEVFETLKEAFDKYGLYQISACCNKHRNYAGKHPITNEKMIWMYYEDYRKLSN